MNCASVSLYATIHSNLINEGAPISVDQIQIEDIERRLSLTSRGTLSANLGPGLSEANIQKINKTVTRKLLKLDQEVEFELKIYSKGLPDIIDSEMKKGHFVSACFSYSFYLKYFKSGKTNHPCLATYENPSQSQFGLGHCVVIIDERVGEYLILDPVCKYSPTLTVEEMSSFVQKYNNKIIRIEKEVFIGEILFGRMDKYDDENRKLITTEITTGNQFKKDKVSLLNFPGMGDLHG